MKMCKLLLILLSVLLLASCDTGFDGDTDTQKEMFNYKYPLKQGNVWEYRVSIKYNNFSNSAVAVAFGADTVSYYKTKDSCKFTMIQNGETAGGVLTFDTQETNSIDSIDNCTYLSSYYITNYSNSEIGYWDNSSYDNEPSMILKYNLYAGDSWKPFANRQDTRKIDSFLNLYGQRVCLIKVTKYNNTDTTYCDEYYSRKGLVKKVIKKRWSSADEDETEIGKFDATTTIELIRATLN